MKQKLIAFIRRLRNNKGFTLIEMLIVLVVVALLMAIIIPNVAGQRERIENQGKENITEIVQTQLNTYRIVEGTSEGVSTQMLADKGYLTAKQVDEAKRLIQLEPTAPITSVISAN